MKHIIFTILTTLGLATAAVSQERTLKVSLPCDKAVNVFNTFRSMNERLIFTGDTVVRESTTNTFYPAGFYIWANLDTQTTSITIMFPDQVMCLVAPVKNFQGWKGDQPWDMPKKKG